MGSLICGVVFSRYLVNLSRSMGCLIGPAMVDVQVALIYAVWKRAGSLIDHVRLLIPLMSLIDCGCGRRCTHTRFPTRPVIGSSNVAWGFVIAEVYWICHVMYAHTVRSIVDRHHRVVIILGMYNSVCTTRCACVKITRVIQDSTRVETCGRGQDLLSADILLACYDNILY